MKPSYLIMSAAWLATIVVAFSIGSKLGSDHASQGGAQQSEARRSAQRAGSHYRNSQDLAATSSASNASQLAAIMSNDNPVARYEAMSEFINQLGSNDFGAVYASFRENFEDGEPFTEFSMLLHAWAKIDPQAALQQRLWPMEKVVVLTAWATDHPEAALDWAEQNPEEDSHKSNFLLLGIMRAIADTDPARATEILATLPSGSLATNEGLRSIAPHIVRQGREKMKAWLESITDEGLRADGAKHLVRILANSDPAAAANWIVGLDDPEAILRSAKSVALIWAESDVDAALTWTSSLSGETEIEAASGLMSNFASKEPGNAASWLKTMSDQPGYDELLETYIDTARWINPELAISHTPQIQNEKSRYESYKWTLSAWDHVDSDAVLRWLAQDKEVPDDLKERYLAREADRKRDQ